MNKSDNLDSGIFANMPDIIAQRTPLVKIGLPAYNRPEGLKNVVNYLISQPYKNIEIYISQNGDYIDNLPDDKRINYIKQPNNIGPIENFYFVYNWAGKCDYFMWMSDDDTFSYNYIESCVNFLEHNTDYSSCAGYNEDITIRDWKMDITSDIPLVRMFQYFYKVGLNGIFYSVFRNDKNYAPKIPYEKNVAFDWVHVAKLSLEGKIKTLRDIYMIRDTEGMSTKPHSEKRTLWKMCRRLPCSVVLFIFLNIKKLLIK